MKKEINCLYGALGGDIIGSVYEFNNIKTKDFPLFSKYSYFTDDSVLTAATAEAIMLKQDYAAHYHRWGNLYPDAGYGGSFLNWLCGDTPGAPYNSWGNGSAMRVSPVGFVFNSAEEVLAEAKRSAECTHDHPEGIKGAQATAYAVFLARNGKSKAAIKSEIEQMFDYDLSLSLDSIRPHYDFDVSCMGTLPVALIAFLESTDYEDAIRNAVSAGGDSDTIAAITGAVALAFYKEMPEEIVAEIEKRLDEPMLRVCRDFQKYCQKGTEDMTENSMGSGNETGIEDETADCFDAEAKKTDTPEPDRAENGFPEEKLRKIIREELACIQDHKKELENEISRQFILSADQIEEHFCALRNILTDMSEKEEALQAKDELFRKVYADLKKHQNGIDRVILAPLLKTAIKWYERVRDMYDYYKVRIPSFGSAKHSYSDLLREFGNFGDYILSALENFDVELIPVEENTVFDPKTTEALETVSTDDPQKDRCIQKCLAPGFRYTDGKMLQYAKVIVYKYEQGEK